MTFVIPSNSSGKQIVDQICLLDNQQAGITNNLITLGIRVIGIPVRIGNDAIVEVSTGFGIRRIFTDVQRYILRQLLQHGQQPVDIAIQLLNEFVDLSFLQT